MKYSEVPLKYTVELSYRQLIVAMTALNTDLELARKHASEVDTQSQIDFWTAQIEWLEQAYNILKDAPAQIA